jgi:F-type H+-transporting ATPase subunit b
MSITRHCSQSLQAPPAASDSRSRMLVGALFVVALASTQVDLLAATGEEHAIRDTIARLLNFGILVGALVYFLKSPIAAYLSSRDAQIRQDLVAAAELRAAAAAELTEIDRRMQALPAELEALKTQGAEDVRAEKARMAQAAVIERQRLLEQTRREIDMRLRIARRQLFELAAQLAVTVARDRIARNITPEDQLRLVDRYTSQLKEAR